MSTSFSLDRSDQVRAGELRGRAGRVDDAGQAVPRSPRRRRPRLRRRPLPRRRDVGRTHRHLRVRQARRGRQAQALQVSLTQTVPSPILLNNAWNELYGYHPGYFQAVSQFFYRVLTL